VSPSGPGLALTSWVGFKAIGADAVAHGDLALLEAEVNPALRAFRPRNGFRQW
jgi:hypothetical protein